MKQLLFNEGMRIDINDVQFDQDELSKLYQAARELSEKAKNLKEVGKKGMISTWNGEAQTSEYAARALSAFCTKEQPKDSDEYIAIKEALASSLMLHWAVVFVEEMLEKDKKKEPVSLDRMPGETVKEHKARLRAYLSEEE